MVLSVSSGTSCTSFLNSGVIIDGFNCLEHPGHDARSSLRPPYVRGEGQKEMADRIELTLGQRMTFRQAIDRVQGQLHQRRAMVAVVEVVRVRGHQRNDTRAQVTMQRQSHVTFAYRYLAQRERQCDRRWQR